MGDEAIFAAQVRDLSGLGDIEVGVMSADPERTAASYGAVPFDVAGGRLSAMRRGVRWADVVVVGGGELAQDRSSLLYTPFNLHPLRLARRCGKPTFAWSVGIGRREELASWTPGQLRKWLGRCRGVTVRDHGSRELLLEVGLDPGRVVLVPDSAFSLAGGSAPESAAKDDVIGAAPRNVANRRGHLLPLEVRRRLGLHRPGDVSCEVAAWAALLDSHLERHGGEVLLFPFHTGTLSNSDDRHCRLVMEGMRHGGRARMVMPGDLDAFLGEMARCRAFITVPLHGAILSVLCGTLPISVPYASKCGRFMSEAGLEDLTVTADGDDGWERLAGLLEAAWLDGGALAGRLAESRERLVAGSRLTVETFARTCLGREVRGGD